MKHSFLTTLVIRLFFVFFLLGLSACATTEQVKVLPDDPDFAPIMPEQDDQMMIPTGSLFKPNYVNNIYITLENFYPYNILWV